MFKKLFLLGLLFLPANILNAEFKIPDDRDDVSAKSLEDVGVRAFTVRYTENAASLLGSSIAVYGVLTSTKPAVGTTYPYVEVRATNTANTASELLFPSIIIASTTRNTLVVFDPPIVAADGISVNLSSAETIATVFYRFLSTNTAEDFWIPLDREGRKGSPQFFGVKASSEAAAGGSANDGLGAEGLDFTAAERIVENRRGFMYGWVSSSNSALGNFVVFEDTASTIGDPGDLLPPIFYNTMTYEHSQSAVAMTKVFRFPWPIAFENGLGVAKSAATDRFRLFTRPARNLR